MGVSTSQWRAAVGRWEGARGVTLCCFGDSESSRPPSFFGLVLAVLLLVSGVEPNPGPVNKSPCELCGALFKTLCEEVEKRERAVSEKERSLLELERQLQEKRRQLNDKQELLEARMNQFQYKEGDVNEREVVLEKKESLLAKREGQISEREGHILERERLVSGREALISDRENKISGRESVVSQLESLLIECKTIALKNVSLVSERSSVDPDPRSSILEQAMGETTVHTEESGGDAVSPSPEVLLAAAAAGRLEDVRTCLEGESVPVDCQDKHGRTPLLLAATNGHLSVVCYLVSDGGAECLTRDKDTGRSALHCAAQNGQLDVVQFLVKEAGANINMKTGFHETALHLAVRENKLDIMHFLLVDGKGNVDIMCKDGRTALHLAVINNNMESLRLLLQQGKADVSVGHANEKTALHAAARAGNLEAVQLMVQAGKINFSNKDKHWGHDILVEAAGNGHLTLVRCLVEQAMADPNYRKNDREPTALHKAVAGQHLQVVVYLVEAGANLSLTAVYASGGREASYIREVSYTPAHLTTSPAIKSFLSGVKVVPMAQLAGAQTSAMRSPVVLHPKW